MVYRVVSDEPGQSRRQKQGPSRLLPEPSSFHSENIHIKIQHVICIRKTQRTAKIVITSGSVLRNNQKMKPKTQLKRQTNNRAWKVHISTNLEKNQ